MSQILAKAKIDHEAHTSNPNTGETERETTMADLEQLKAEIAEIGETIRTLKAANDSSKSSDIQAAVNRLLLAKQTYAEHNNGIGVDGKPFGQKKDKKKEKGPPVQVRSDWFVYLCFSTQTRMASLTLCAFCKGS